MSMVIIIVVEQVNAWVRLRDGLARALYRRRLRDDPVLLLIVPGARLHGVQLNKVDDRMVLRHVSDAQQSFLEGVQRDLRSDSVFLIEDLECRRVVAVRQVKLELRVGRSEVVLGVLELDYRAHERLILVFVGVLLAEQLQSELFV